MWSKAEWLAYCDRYQLSRAARDYLDEMRSSGPSRQVGTHARGNIAVWHSSEMMGGTISSESWTGESYYILEREYDRNTQEYWTQPPPLRVLRTDRKGHRRRGSYTADGVVIPTDAPPYVVEIKSHAKIQALLQDGHPDWKIDKDACIYVPAQAAYADLGLTHRVVVISSATRIRQANLAVLIQARNAPVSYDDGIRRRIESALDEAAWLTLRSLQDQAGLSDVTPLIQLIDAGVLYADLNETLLSDPDTAVVAADQSAIEYWRTLRMFDDNNYSDSVVSREKVPTRADASQALRNMERLHENDGSRHARRLRRQVEKGRENGLTPHQALLGKRHRSGNRTQKIPQTVRDYLDEYLAINWGSARRLSQRKAYRAYCVLAKEKHPQYDPVSRTTFRRAIDGLDAERVEQGRGGRRASAAARSPSPVEERAIRHVLPYQIATVDHYQVDLHIVIIQQATQIYTARPWLTVMKDLYSDQVLGRYVSINAPSRVSCAMVMRDCVRRHQRLPAMIMVDRGAEFVSEYFRSLLADLGIDLAVRPASEPRYGAEAERLFGELRSEWLSYLDGNSVQWYESRSVSSSHAPQNQATLTPKDLLDQIDTFLTWREGTLHGAALDTPVMAESQLASIYPFVGRAQTIDREFIIKTAVDVREYKVDPRRGIHMGNDMHYWAPELREVTRKAQVDVRVDPEQPYQIYALVHGTWVTCQASGNIRYQRQARRDQEVEALRRYGVGSLRAQARRDAQEDLVRLQVAAADSGNEYEHESVSSPVEPSGESQPKSLFDQVREETVETPLVDLWNRT